MRRTTHRSLVPALLVIAIVVVSTDAWFAFRSLNSIQNSQFWVEHTWRVIDQVQNIISAAEDAETGVRRYLLSGDENYLDSYKSASKDLGASIDQVQRLTADNPNQQERARTMRALLAQRMESLARSIQERKSETGVKEQVLELSNTEKVERERLRLVANEMEVEERGLLSIRTATVRTDFLRARVALVVATALDLFLIVVMFSYLAREQRLRVQAEQSALDLVVAQQETQQKAEEIHALNEELENRVQQRTAELEVTNRELEAFSYSVSHDLRAPLRTIDGFSLALEEDYLDVIDDTGKDYIRRVRSGVQRMGQLIDSLLQLSRITRAEITREDFNLSELAEAVAARLSEENPDLKTTFDIEANLQANGDPRLVQVALENLLGNALKFSSKTEDPRVQFGWDSAKDAWFVRDNGAGFDMHYAPKLFNAFNRLHGDKDFKGSGIGLATVARVIRRHHGRIWADSIVGQGATFWFNLGKEFHD